MNIVQLFINEVSEILFRLKDRPDQVTTHVTQYFENLIKGRSIADYYYTVTADPPIHPYIEIKVHVTFNNQSQISFVASSRNSSKTNDPISDYDRAMGIVGKR